MEYQFSLAKYDHDDEIAKEASDLASGELFDVDLTFYLPIPKSASMVKKNAMAWNLDKPNVKPDTDNLVKFYFDCGNEVLWKDDKQIMSLTAKKKYSYNPRVEINIMLAEKSKIFDQSKDIISYFNPEQCNNILKVFSELVESFETEEEPNDQVAILLYVLSRFHKEFKKINEKYPTFVEDLRKHIKERVHNEVQSSQKTS